jgi:hypothetical protein
MRRQFSVRFALDPLFLVAITSTEAEAAIPGFVQQNFETPQSTSVSSVSVTFAAVQNAGDMNVVVDDPVNAVDNNTAASGDSDSSNSGSVVTTNAADLLIAANTIATTTSDAGSGFTSIRRCRHLRAKIRSVGLGTHHD